MTGLFFQFPAQKEEIERDSDPEKLASSVMNIVTSCEKSFTLIIEITFCLPYKHNAFVTEGQCKTYLDDQKGSEKSLSTHNSLV